MEAFKPQTAEEWDALMQTTTQPYVQALIIEARAKETPFYNPPLNEVWGTPLEDEGIIWGNYLENTESLADGVVWTANDVSSDEEDTYADTQLEDMQDQDEKGDPLEQDPTEADEDYFDRLASLYDESKRGKQDPNIEYAFDHVMERNLHRTYFQRLDQLTANGYRMQLYK
jgi:hypothetical protein